MEWFRILTRWHESEEDGFVTYYVYPRIDGIYNLAEDMAYFIIALGIPYFLIYGWLHFIWIIRSLRR